MPITAEMLHPTPRQLRMTDPTPTISSAPSPPLGMRLQAVEVFNWGTFDQKVWRLDLHGDNILLTGDIGSGKSTIVDAITTLLIPANRIAYNRAAGAELRERDLRSYVLGYYKSERGFTGDAAKPVPLRTPSNYSVVLGRFYNAGYDEAVTLAQVFWFRESHGQPERFYVVCDKLLTVAEHFSSFGRDFAALKKRLRKVDGAEIFDSFPPYGGAFRRRFGIASDQALDLFHQTVSMKSVGDLTDFVRSHMLEAFPVEQRITDMISHFEDLTRAYEAVLKARAQIEELRPIITDCDAYAGLSAEIDGLRTSRDTLRPYFSSQKATLLQFRIDSLAQDISRLDERLRILRDRERSDRKQRDDLKQAIHDNGGDRLAAIDRDIEIKEAEKRDRQDRANAYGRLAGQLVLPAPQDLDQFVANQPRIVEGIASADTALADVQNAYTEHQIAFRDLKTDRDEAAAEIESLRKRRTNIPSRMLAIREQLCTALGLNPEYLPFSGELIEVRAEHSEWEGAAERLLRGFALSLLVADQDYADVADWVDRNHLGERIVYYRVQSSIPSSRPRPDGRSLAAKLAVKEGEFFDWVRREIDIRFNHVCCSTLEEFRREQKAITRTGQTKSGGNRHEKDDRSRINDRTTYVLGWTNESKIAALQKVVSSFEHRLQKEADHIAELQRRRNAHQSRLALLQQLSAFTSFRDLDWRSVAVDIAQLLEERRQLEEGSDKLKTLQEQLIRIERALTDRAAEIDGAFQDRTRRDERCQQAQRDLQAAEAELQRIPEAERQQLFERLDRMRMDLFGEHKLSIENCDARERELREALHKRIDNETAKLARLREKIVAAMRDYCNRFQQDTYDVDASVDATDDYRSMLAALEADGLPRFELRFKELLNENTIREVAGFQSQLRRESQDIHDRIDTINQSLLDIDYNQGRYIVLEVHPSLDAEVRDFVQDLRTCTENTLTGSDDNAYSEAKFLEVRRIIERFRGRDGQTETDKRWTRKVTDVRNWFTFSASERWRSTNEEHEHYSDSGGKSGGQKEKLAYTILAASLAYQFGLDWRAERTRAFHFVVIDEAFGRGSDESARYGLELFQKMGLQLLIATPLQKIHIIEPFIAGVGFVHNEDGKNSMLRNVTVEEYRQERLRRAG